MSMKRSEDGVIREVLRKALTLPMAVLYPRASPRHWRTPLRTFPALISLAVSLLLVTTYFLTRQSNFKAVLYSLKPLEPGRQRHGFWKDAFCTLAEVEPRMQAIKLKENAPGENWPPKEEHARANLISLSPEEQHTLTASHAQFVDKIPALSRRLYFAAGTTGIVTTASAKSFGQVVTLVIAVRQSGSKLPIQVILDSTAPWIDDLCAGSLKTLHASCIVLPDVWNTARAPPMQGFQWKVVSILASSFQDVLFLNSDVLPVQNPDGIFAPKGVEPFTSSGLITWPDFWTPSVHELFYKIAGDLPVPSILERSSSEAGMIVVDKSRHAETMLLALYYNIHGPKYYYPLLCQGGAGAGDKETFLQAALVLAALAEKNGTRKESSGFWDVKRLPRVHGRKLKNAWRGMFMQQMDPREDYRVVYGMLVKSLDSQKAENKDIISSRSWFSEKRRPKPPVDKGAQLGKHLVGRVKNSTEDQKMNNNGLHTTGTPYPHPENTWRKPPDDAYQPLSMFFHHNGMKLDFTNIVESYHGEENPITAKNEAGQFVRLWGDPDWIIDRTGRDVERDLWTEATKLYCGSDMEKLCEAMTGFVTQVFN